MIAQRAGLKRPNTYVLLEKLMKRGFVSSGSKYGTKTFSAVPPRELLGVLQKEKIQYEKRISSLEEQIPELEALQSSHSTKPKVLFFEGKASTQRMHEHILNEKAWSGFVDTQGITTGFSEDYFRDIVYQISQTTKPIRDIYTDSPIAREIKKKYENQRYQVKLLKGVAPFNSDEVIFDDKFAIASFEQESLHLIEIHSTAMAKGQMMLFDHLWHSL